MEGPERLALIEHYARLLRAHIGAEKNMREVSARGHHVFHRRIRRSDIGRRAARSADEIAETSGEIYAEAVHKHGLTKAELVRWMVDLDYESGKIEPPPKLLDILLENSG